MKKYGMIGMGVLALGLMVLPGVARAQAQRDVPGPIDSLRDLQDTGRMIFMMADTNHDGQVSQKEAVDAAYLTVGGFFFRADANGDGTVTRDEARAAREAYLGQNPWMRYIVETVRVQRNQQNSNQPNPLQNVLTVLDSNNDKQVQASELRQLVQTTVQSAFAAADTNRDGQLSPSEVNAATAGAARAVAQAAFQQADTDNNGALSRAEYDKAIIQPADVLFQIADLNHDGQLSQQEAQTISRTIVRQARMMRLPEPANSPTNLIESGRLPREAGPVPTFGTQGGGQPGQQPGSVPTAPAAPPQ
jgi:Ca2+-binding EF-hand superfamily protein